MAELTRRAIVHLQHFLHFDLNSAKQRTGKLTAMGIARVGNS